MGPRGFEKSVTEETHEITSHFAHGCIFGCVIGGAEPDGAGPFDLGAGAAVGKGQRGVERWRREGPDGDRRCDVSLYKDQEGGAALWLETQNVKADSNGRDSVSLGVRNPEGLPADLFAAGQARWLGVRASGQAEQP